MWRLSAQLCSWNSNPWYKIILLSHKTTTTIPLINYNIYYGYVIIQNKKQRKWKKNEKIFFIFFHFFFFQMKSCCCCCCCYYCLWASLYKLRQHLWWQWWLKGGGCHYRHAKVSLSDLNAAMTIWRVFIPFFCYFK